MSETPLPTDDSVLFLHNPRCSKSRQTLNLLKEHGVEPVVVEYLQDTPGADELKDILAKLGLGPRDIMRKGEKVEAKKHLKLYLEKEPEAVDRGLISQIIEGLG